MYRSYSTDFNIGLDMNRRSLHVEITSMFLFLKLSVSLNLYLGNILLKLPWVNLLFKPVYVSTCSIVGSFMKKNSHFINFGCSSTRYLREDEPSNHNGDCSCARKAITFVSFDL